MFINWKSPAFIEGAKVSGPSQFGMGAWGLVVGVAMIKAGLTLPQALGMTLLVFAGSAQLAALPLIAANAPVWVIFVTALVVNLRFLIMSALIAPRFAHLHWFKRMVLGFYTGDITVALFMNRYPDMWQNAQEDREQREFLKGLLVPNWFVWQATSIIGILLGSQVPTHWGLGFAGTLAILCVMLPLIQNRAAVVGVLVASVVAILGHAIPYKLGLLLAVLIGMASAMWYEEHFDVVVPDLNKEGESHE
jgi:predicted branched-subunit amino acid permease